MNVNILTLPISGNYGGMLQAYALQSVLIKNGYNARIVNYKTVKEKSILVRLKSFIKNILIFAEFDRFEFNIPFLCRNRMIFGFRKKYINELFFDPYKLCRSKVNEDDIWIVGSDQVWRGLYAKDSWNLAFFFLNFLKETTRKNSISYAASYGADEWEGKPEETEECGQLLRQFKSVSVREHSGIDICKKKFGVTSTQMPDPTLLLKTNDYDSIIDGEQNSLPETPYIAAYILDQNKGKSAILDITAESLGLSVQFLMPRPTAPQRKNRYPVTISQWLCWIREAKYVVTDSFHGCVFAIIYNKPFVCLGNKERGSARFDSLLRTFGLRDRMFIDASDVELIQLLSSPIDWDRVNAIHDAERERGIKFLKENI